MSIIIPTYNDDPDHLAAAVESALAQTYGDVEIVVVDDGSTQPVSIDGVRVIRQDNEGTSSAVTTGIAATDGEFVLILGGDDRMDAHLVAESVTLLQDDREAVAAIPHLEQFGDFRTKIGEMPFEARLADLIFRNRIVATAMFRRSTWEACGGYDRTLQALEDWELWVRFLAQTNGLMRRVPTAKFYYRIRSVSRNTYGMTPEAHDAARARMVANNPDHLDRLFLAMVDAAHRLQGQLWAREAEVTKWRRRVGPARGVWLAAKNIARRSDRERK
ncbi:glycosyltransferase family A protein [Ornithinimicrobium cerasi]|uniref:glycosyltransferase family A protein n=1 Tax=Ornithinimicrobium cerasi TaxID=2248773 RepID=UPI001379A8F2|nr:glycosyltransferase family A protein [Ornithinimicrobium cerasi]